MDFGEDLKGALKREVKEEVNLEIDVSKLLYATTFKTSEYRQVVILTYLCTAYNNDVKLSPEHKDFMWANKKQMIELLAKPIINDIESNSVWDYLKID